MRASLGHVLPPTAAVDATRHWSLTEVTRVSWFVLLIAAICFEGIARKFLPIPKASLYFLKDLILVGGAAFGIRAVVTRTIRRLYGIALVPAALAVAVVLLQLFNPEQTSLPLGLVGLRSYCLWW